MAKAKRYFILAEKQNGQWCLEFGDYERATVESEYDDKRDHDVSAKFLKIIATKDDQATIDAAIARLNSKEDATRRASMLLLPDDGETENKVCIWTEPD